MSLRKLKTKDRSGVSYFNLFLERYKTRNNTPKKNDIFAANKPEVMNNPDRMKIPSAEEWNRIKK